MKAFSTIMPAGTYYIGDLCYVMDSEGEWDRVCAEFEKNKWESGKYKLDGRVFVSCFTRYGDGSYSDESGSYEFAVDAGLIGCIKIDDIKSDFKEWLNSGYAEVTFKTDFEVSVDSEGVIIFGHIVIPTGDLPYDDEDEDDWDWLSDDDE